VTTAAIWVTAIYGDESGEEFERPAVLVATVTDAGRPAKPIAWDLDGRTPRRCTSWPNFRGLRP